jgi:hypothetical protein
MGVTKTISAAVAGAFLIAGSAGATAIKMKKTELPEAVREAVNHSAPGAHISSCWRLEGDGEAKYEVDLKVDGKKRGVVVAADGKVLTVQEEMSWEDLPGRVQERFKQIAGDHDVEEVHSIWQHGEIVGYGARIDGDHGDFNVEVGPHGEAPGDKAAGQFREPSRDRDAWRERTPGPVQTNPDQEKP